MLRYFGSWWEWGQAFPMTRTNFPLMGRTRLRFPKQQHVLVDGMAALKSNHQHSRRYAGELSECIAAPGFQVLSWNSHPHLLSLWIKLFVFLPYIHTIGQTIRLLVYLCECRHSCLLSTPACDLVAGLMRHSALGGSCFTPAQLTTAAQLLGTSISGRKRMVPKTARAQWDQSPLHW